MRRRRPTTKLRHALLGVVRRAWVRTGWSARELGRRADLSRTTVGHVLRGRHVTLDALEALMLALDVHDGLVTLLYSARDSDGRLMLLTNDLVALDALHDQPQPEEVG